MARAPLGPMPLGPRPLGSPGSRPPDEEAGRRSLRLAAVEADEEVRVTRQVFESLGRVAAAPGASSPPAPPPLPSGGRYDELLAPGCAAQLCQELPRIFAGDPAPGWGRDGSLVGLSCALGARYASEVFSPAAVVQHLRLADQLWAPGPEGNILRISAPPEGRLVLLGDTHGQLEDVLWVFFKYGLPSAKNAYIFIGDIVDRGGHALEILLLLLAFKRDEPGSVHIIRGNHEDVNCAIQFGFRVEIEHKFQQHYGAVFQACIQGLFPALPLAAIVGGPAGHKPFFCVHGGVPLVPDGPVSIEADLVRANRNRPTLWVRGEDRESDILFNFLWADPVETASEEKGKGRGNKFTAQDTNAFLERNGLELIIRAHEVKPRGVTHNHGSRCLTLFSASNYGGNHGNYGGVILFDSSMESREHWAPPWPKLAEFLADGRLTAPASEREVVAERYESEFLHPASSSPQSGAGSRPSSRPPSAGSSGLPSPSRPSSGGAADMEKFMLDRIILHKPQLFEGFRRADPEHTGLLSRAQWTQVMLQELGSRNPEVVTAVLLEELAVLWRLSEPCPYAKFLHRFQVQGVDSAGGRAGVDLFRVISNIHDRAQGLSAKEIHWILDPNGDHAVSVEEFQAFLPKFGTSVPPMQAAALYQAMCDEMQRGQPPLTLDNTILFLSVACQDPLPANEWRATAEEIGREIRSHRVSFAQVFRNFDTDRDGFLSHKELEKGLCQSSVTTQKLTPEQVSALIHYIESMGIPDDQISMFEFVRALAPAGLAMNVQQAMVKGVLRRIFLARPTLLSQLYRYDPRGTRQMTTEQFKACLDAVSIQLQAQGRQPLSQPEVHAVCEIASNAGPTVAYEQFLHGLVVADTGEVC